MTRKFYALQEMNKRLQQMMKDVVGAEPLGPEYDDEENYIRESVNSVRRVSDEIARLSNDNRLLISHELHAEIENLPSEVGMLDVVFCKWTQLDIEARV